MLYRFMELTLGSTLRTVFRPEVLGLGNVPTSGPVIFAANHDSFSDEFFIPIAARRQVFYFAKAEYFTTPGLRGRAMAAFFHGLGQVPVERGDTRSAAAVIEVGMEVLNAGNGLGIFPEGTRSPDGRLYRGKTGVARMALEARVPVIPCAMIDTDKVQPIGKRLPRIRRVGIRIGAPLDFSRYEGLAGDRFVERSMTDEIMYELMQLSGQEYVDLYAAKVKAERSAALAATSPGPREAADRAPAEQAS
jgi:1-acyl-sn-glycerol-3-phosphate acyltransferase